MKNEDKKYCILDVEADGLQPTKIHCVVCRDVETGEHRVFRSHEGLAEYLTRFDCIVGHNSINYDTPVVSRLWGVPVEARRNLDTLILSRLVNYSRPEGHSLEAWGRTLGFEKVGEDIKDWSRWTQEIEDRCVADTEINRRLFLHLQKYVDSPKWQEAIRTEHDIASVCLDIHNNGFAFDIDKAKELYHYITKEVGRLDEELQTAFPPRTKFIKEYLPRPTKFGTISRSSVPRGFDCAELTVGAPFSTFIYEPFNPGSPKQIVERLNEAGWKPFEKTKGHKDALRSRDKEALKKFSVYGWTVSEANLETLPPEAPPAAKTLTRWLTLRSRRGKIEEWFAAYRDSTKRIHGTINSIGTWTHRMSHTDPNMGNIPTAKPQDTDEYKRINDTMRECWVAASGAYLVGVDADGIQLRILAHYMEDPRFIEALVKGRKEDKTDVHSLNAVALGEPCKGRRDAKTFIYAWVLGARIPMVAHILACSRDEAETADANFRRFYPGLGNIIENVVPAKTRVGYVEGIDGRYILLSKKKLETNPVGAVLGAWLQNGESVVMKKANLLWRSQLEKEGLLKFVKQVNYVHDEWQSEVYGDYDLALHVANVQSDSIKTVGELYGLKCPLAGSILGGHEKIAIGRNWLETH